MFRKIHKTSTNILTLILTLISIYGVWCIFDYYHYRNFLGNIEIISAEVKNNNKTTQYINNNGNPLNLISTIISVNKEDIIVIEYRIYRKRISTIYIERNFISDSGREYNLFTVTKYVTSATLGQFYVKSDFDIPDTVKECGHLFSRTTAKFSNNVLSYMNPITIDGPKLRICINIPRNI